MKHPIVAVEKSRGTWQTQSTFSEGAGFRAEGPFLQGAYDSAHCLINTRERSDPWETSISSGSIITWQVSWNSSPSSSPEKWSWWSWLMFSVFQFENLGRVFAHSCLLFSCLWLSDFSSIGPSFYTCVWWLIWIPPLTFGSCHHSALTCKSLSSHEDPSQPPEIESIFISKGILDTPPSEHLWVPGGILSWEMDITPTSHYLATSWSPTPVHTMV